MRAPARGVESIHQSDVPAKDKRSSDTAKVAVKSGQIAIKRSEGKSIKSIPQQHNTYVTEVKELAESTINNEPPVHWILLSSQQINSIETGLKVIEWYKQRWNIEQVFRRLKTKGLKIESSQLGEYEEIQKITILALIAAVKVIQLIRCRDGKTGLTIAAIFNKEEQECLTLLNR
jgi:hypothetical protein